MGHLHARVNLIATHSGFPQDGAVLKMIWVYVRKLVVEGREENGEREKGRNSECVFLGGGRRRGQERNLNLCRGQKL